MNSIAQIMDRMNAAGFEVNDISVDTPTVQRIPRSKNEKKKNAWYIIRSAKLRSGKTVYYGSFGDWRTGEVHNLRQSTASRAERAEVASINAELLRNVEHEIEKSQAIAAQEAQKLVGRIQPAVLHPYLERKRIRSHGVYESRGDLFIPTTNINGELTGGQFIKPDGSKLFMKGQKVKGCFFVLGDRDLARAKSVIVVEGFATGASVQEATNETVICAFNAKNIHDVTKALRKEFPRIKITIVADNDQFTKGNPGLSEALAAAENCNAMVTYPRFSDDAEGKPTDANDLLVTSGSDAVREMLKARSYPKTETPPASQLAEDFLEHKGLAGKTQPWFTFAYGEAYAFVKTHYRRYVARELFAEVIAFLQSRISSRAKSGKSLTDNVIANLHGIAKLGFEPKVPCFLDAPDKSARDIISFRNGILNINDHTNELRDHDPMLFCTASLPFDFNPKIQCPTWLRFLEEVLPDADVRNLLQEWFGLNLIFDTSFAKFVLLVGEGANGKSVICLVLRTLLGRENVSAVNLESLDPKRTFVLASTVGKLANVISDQNKIDSVAEGEVKKFVSGELMVAENKFGHPFEFTPTARLTVATNELPTITDSSDGLWRRMIVIPFQHQISDESKQNKELVKESFWIESHEMSGVFNWALEGLRRLKARGHFCEPNSVLAAKTTYRMDSNPARTFLTENCHEDPTQQISSMKLYEQYKEHVLQQGVRVLSAQAFGKEVRRAFKSAELTPNPLRQPGLDSRSRNWIGVAFKPESAL